jgi:uncharacterized protein (TIGR03437 family)
MLFLAVSPAGAVRFDPNPPAATAGAATVIVDVLRTNEPGDVGGFSEDELDTFEWFGPNSSLLTGTPVKLPRATLLRDNLVRLQLDAARLAVPGIATIAYTQDPSGRRQRHVFAFFINRPPQIEGVLTGGPVNTRIAQTVEALHGTGPYRWSIASGSLPPGVALVGRAQFADFTGTPTTPGNYTFTLRVTDGSNISAEKAFTVVVAAPPGPPLRISTAALPPGVVGSAYRAALEATGGTPPYQWSSTGGLPAGLSISTAGVVSGTPTAAGTFNVSVRVQDATTSSDRTVSVVIELIGRFTSVQAASFEPGVSARQAIVAGYGENLAAALVTAPQGTVPQSLAGVSVVIRDTGGQEAPAMLFFVSPTQINYLVPARLEPGPAVVNVQSGGRTIATGSLLIQTVAPGIFTANADGKGVAAASYLRAGPPITTGTAFRCDAAPGTCRPEPIDLGDPADRVFLQLFATGLRNGLTVTATIGGETVPVTYAGAQNEYFGLDQINLGPLPRSLSGRGTVMVLVKVDGKDANPVTIAFR